MTWLRIALLPVLLYVLADFASPQVAGAVSFEADGCVDGVRPERLRTTAERPPVAPDVASHTLERPAPSTPAERVDAVGRGRSRITLARDPRYAAADPPSAADDH